MKKIYRILGQRGRITIPYAIRVKLGFNADDVLSFKESKDGKSVIICREKICDGCQSKTSCVAKPKKGKLRVDAAEDKITLYDFLNGLSPEQQRAALVHLSVKWAASQGGEKNA
jgi:bifunctional DNA-binding transcriptional regulator/antitoxin component of YhaV-PrlF toxin-antitoxin module